MGFQYLTHTNWLETKTVCDKNLPVVTSALKVKKKIFFDKKKRKKQTKHTQNQIILEEYQ